jgi:hypothetical protein
VEFELRRLEHFTTKAQVRRRVPAWIEEYDHDRRHSALGMRSPVGTAGRSYFGGRSEANARSTVDLPIPQIPRDLPLRNTIRNQPPDQSPILHRDHPSNLSGWPRFQPSLWPRFRASSTRCPVPAGVSS